MHTGRNLAALMLALALAFASQIASAFMDPPVLVTSNPVPGQPVLISMNVGVCDAVLADPPPTITRTGNDILMVVPTIHSYSSDFCIYPTTLVTLVVGSLTVGNYSLQVDRSYIGDVGPVTVLLGTFAFTVAVP